jgi:5-methyltetrahydropteroyltriglutamate--homocysteine methyltransferase
VCRFTDLDRRSLSPQCGFASTKEGNILTQREQMGEAAADRRDRQEIWD